MAQKLADVIFRRTTLGLSGYPGVARLQACAAIMARELGWDDERTHREVDAVQAVFGTPMQGI
jgi:glycerol-3-phosphate dehydrogenase